MTRLNKKVRRETFARLDLDKFSRGRPIIIELEPPDLISFRWKGLQKKYSAPVSKLMQITIQAHVDAERRERKRKK